MRKSKQKELIHVFVYLRMQFPEVAYVEEVSFVCYPEKYYSH